MDGNGALFGTLSGNTREVLHKFTVDLPKKHGRGGQSALRFARLRMEKRHNYRLQGKILKLVDVSYGGENGFNQAIELSAEVLSNVKFIQEKKLIGRYFDEISQDTGKFCFGVEDTFKGLEMGAVETLIVWENLEYTRFVLKNHASDEDKVLHLNAEQEKDKTHFIDKETGVELELVESQPLLEWLANNYKTFGKLKKLTRRIGGLFGYLAVQHGTVTFHISIDRLKEFLDSQKTNFQHLEVSSRLLLNDTIR
ncbi:putative eukaryotic peptide chain release factor subunit 1 [Apostichopus japonicus]|uniref:Putative eukaryotic peptide chain release factor subunit 1 n=1 Tax=Stichopus japonicus TaxID=307972 RepID=A0A2G8L6H8_STIJA|nr:putative eukaryotic peptide chain release factor subunit 1 [Apostichopus japonicus]